MAITEFEPEAGRRFAVRPVAMIIGAQLIAGIGVGLIWRAWAPKTIGYVLAGQGGSKITIPDESESQIAGDGRFLLLCAVVGLLAGLGAWQFRRIRGPIGLLALAVGAVAGSLVAREVGVLLATGHSSGALNSTIRLPLTLHAEALLASQAFVAVLVYVFMAGLSADDQLGIVPSQQPPSEQPLGRHSDPAVSPAAPSRLENPPH
jgi:hypothetical protein